MSGFFVSFEGGEGTGKSTQVGLLADNLRARGFEVATTREPGGSEGAEALRHILLSGRAKSVGDDGLEAVLFAAARADHVASFIRPALARGAVVLCDRFHDSTRVYQGLAGDDRTLMVSLEKAVLGRFAPDLTILLDVPAKLGLERARTRRGDGEPDRFEIEETTLHEKRRQRFLEIAQQEPQRCVVVDGARAVDAIAREIAFVVGDRLDGGRLASRGPDGAALDEPTSA